ncbi:MAG: polysaccharide pyruvyl transferase family protein [Bacteroidales bacterium]|nr:polysaccharide pyruvyl transferase family protein [Bacteroidales bacterium]
MKAIIVPGVTDLNKGDQALVWESYRLIEDTKMFNQIFILDSGDTYKEKTLLCNQSKKKGFPMLNHILPHPRRGRHQNEEHVVESRIKLLSQIGYAIYDFLSSFLLLSVCNHYSLVKFFFSRKTSSTVKQFKEVDAVFVKGGGFIHTYGEKTAPYLMWYFLFYVRLAQRLGKKVIFLPNSYGPFDGFTVKKQLRSVLKKIDIIYAREHVSAEKLGNLLDRDIDVEMDLGFFLQNKVTKDINEILHKYQLSSDDNIVGVTVRPWRFPGTENPFDLYKNYIDSMVDLIKYITGKGYKVVLCNQSLGPNAHEDDRNAIKDVLSKTKNLNVVWLNENLDCVTLKAVYSNFDFFIGTRFHSIIFSLTSLVPSMAIAYGGNKANGIMKDFGLDDYVLSIDQLNFQALKITFDNLVAQSDEIKHKLELAQVHIYNSRKRIIDHIQKLWKN